MSDGMRLRVYRFDPGTPFDGHIIDALERIDVASDIRLLDALLVTRDAATDELHAIDRATGRADGTIAAMLDFRLDPSSRRATTERTLGAHPGGVPADVIKQLATCVERGGAVLAVLVAGGPPAELEDAVARIPGHLAADEPAGAGTLAEVGPQLLRAAERPPRTPST